MYFPILIVVDHCNFKIKKSVYNKLNITLFNKPKKSNFHYMVKKTQNNFFFIKSLKDNL